MLDWGCIHCNNQLMLACAREGCPIHMHPECYGFGSTGRRSARLQIPKDLCCSPECEAALAAAGAETVAVPKAKRKRAVRDASKRGNSSAAQAAAAPKGKRTKHSKKSCSTDRLESAVKAEAGASNRRTLFLHTCLKAVPGVWGQECAIVVFQHKFDKALKQKKRGDLKVSPAERVYRFNGRHWSPQCWKCFVGGIIVYACYKDLQGRAACARHAREDGVHVKQALCVKCLGNGVETNSCYKDALGRHACAKHAREDGTHVKKALCVKCLGKGVETSSSYKDALGRHACARHAREDGTYVKRVSR